MTPQKPQKLFNLIQIVWQYGTKVHATFWPWGTPRDPIYDHFWVLCWLSFCQYSIFWCMWGHMKVYKAIWRYIKLLGGIGRHISIYELTLTTLFFSTFVGPTFSTLFFFNFLVVHFYPFCFFSLFGGLHAPGGISSFFSSNFPSNGVRIMSGDPFLTPIMTIFINVTYK